MTMQNDDEMETQDEVQETALTVPPAPEPDVVEGEFRELPEEEESGELDIGEIEVVEPFESPEPVEAPEPISLPEPEPEPEIVMPEMEEPGSRWTWVGDASEAKSEDGISDLFEVDDEDIADDPDDVTDVDLEEDILDAGEEGDLSDLVDVDEDDIIGSRPAPTPARARRVKRPWRPSNPSSGLSGLRG